MSTSEDVLLQMGEVRYKKNDGTLYVMNERVAWMIEHRDTVTVAHKFVDIKSELDLFVGLVTGNKYLNFSTKDFAGRQS